ncbi:DUF397 domain-containing protein [Actinacidiphila oryziradicis]|uniref:DUF397 domain-containing protein n=1 Tax=Actinacidiphila oryziradicis TaxID=2571141 RepID=A0A4U0RZC8_9ACTN|nr:DUF397 domain-containing protein [Actinacidiphila oryziradicis]TKA00181.1 DUF397 domain-containing protein [Actinacidiphila oryziradicis]
MNNADENTWFKSSYSGAGTSECIETAFLSTGVAVRDSTDPDGPRLQFAGAAWTSFVGAIRERQLV